MQIKVQISLHICRYFMIIIFNVRKKSPIIIIVCNHRRTIWKIGSHVKYVILLKYRNEPHHEKTGLSICENKDADQLRSNQEADQHLCFRYIDRTIPLLSKSEISCLYPSSVAVQPGLCQTWSETPKTGFLTTMLKLSLFLSFCLFLHENLGLGCSLKCLMCIHNMF